MKHSFINLILSFHSSQKPPRRHPKRQTFCLRRKERRICFLSTQLPRSPPPPPRFCLLPTYYFPPPSLTTPPSPPPPPPPPSPPLPTIFLSLNLYLSSFLPLLHNVFPNFSLSPILPSVFFVFSLCCLLVPLRRIPCLLPTFSPLQYVSFLPPPSLL